MVTVVELPGDAPGDFVEGYTDIVSAVQEQSDYPSQAVGRFRGEEDPAPFTLRVVREPELPTVELVFPEGAPAMTVEYFEPIKGPNFGANDWRIPWKITRTAPPAG